MGGRAVGSSFGRSPKDLKSRLRAPHRDWPREAHVPRARSEGSNSGLVATPKLPEHDAERREKTRGRS